MGILGRHLGRRGDRTSADLETAPGGRRAHANTSDDTAGGPPHFETDDAVRRAQALAEADAFYAESQRESVARRESQVLDGPAGDYVHGRMPDLRKPSQAAANTSSIGAEFKQAFKGLTATVKDLADPKGLLGIGSDMPAGIKDPVERRAVAANERCLRDEARAPYLAAPAPRVVMTRIATRGRTQFDEVAGYLASTGMAARPDLVYGVFRIPDRISPLMLGSEDGRVVEWAIVHTAPQGAASSVPRWIRFDASQALVARAEGQPSVLDEDVVIAALNRSGLGPQHCLGICREIRMEQIADWVSDSGQTSNSVFARVTGVRVLIPQIDLAATDSLDVPLAGNAGVHVEVMNWAAVAQAVHPRRQRGPEIPSPFAYLPATPDELLVAYLQIVGVHPADCYTASMTIDDFFAMGERTTRDNERISLADLKLTDAEQFPCADGKPRRRLHGTTHIVVAYADRPAYVEGRERWARYQSDVLHARLSLRTGARRPIGGGSGLEKAVDVIAGIAGKINRLMLQPPTAHERYAGQYRYIAR